MHNKKPDKRPNRFADSGALILVCIAIGTLLFLGCFFRLFPKNAMRYMIRILLYITMGEMWNLMSGFSGITSLGQQLYIGITGYTMAVTTSYYRVPLGTGLLLAFVVNILLAAVLALFLFRIQGMYFTIATWVIAEVFMLLFLGWDYVGQGRGMTFRFPQYPQIGEICILALLLCVGAVVLICLLLRSKIGIGLMAMRDDSKAAAVVVNIVMYRFLIYVLAAAFIGLAGGIFFVNKGVIYPESGFGISWTVSMVFIVTIGGIGTFTGPIVGSIIYVFLEEYLAHFPGWSNIILGVITILVILFLPKGIMGTVQQKTNVRLIRPKCAVIT